MKVLETPNGTQRRTGNPCLQHSSGLLQAVCAQTELCQPAWSLLWDAGEQDAAEETLCTGDLPALHGHGAAAVPYSSFPCQTQHTGSFCGLFQSLQPADHPWFAQAPPHSSSHPSSRHGTYGPQAREPKQNQAASSKGRQKTATIAPGLEQNCHLLPQKSQNRSQPGAGKNNILS